MNGEDKYSIYCLRCPISLKIRYIGLTNNLKRRKAQHTANILSEYNTYLKNWKNKLKKQGLKPIFEPLISGLTKSEAQQAEIDEILNCKIQGCKLVNLSPGGEACVGSKALKGKKLKDIFPQEIYEKLLISRSHKGKNNPNFGGVNCSKEWRENQIKSQSKKPLLVYLRDGTFVGEFRNSKECAKFLKCPPSSVRMFKNKNWAIKRKFLIKSKM